MTDTKPWAPVATWEEPVTLASAVGQALGTASTCWKPEPTDLVFDSERAKWVFEGMMAWLSDWADTIREDANEKAHAALGPEGARLGMASAREMLLELRARGEMWPFVDDKESAGMYGTFLRRRADEALTRLPREMLDERVVKQ